MRSNSQQGRGGAVVSIVESRLEQLGLCALIFCRGRKRLLPCHLQPLRPSRLERRGIELRLRLFYGLLVCHEERLALDVKFPTVLQGEWFKCRQQAHAPSRPSAKDGHKTERHWGKQECHGAPRFSAASPK